MVSRPRAWRPRVYNCANMGRRILLLLAVAAQSYATTGVRLVLGLSDAANIAWDGSVTARGARISSLEGWRFEGNDAILPDNSWRLAIHAIRLFGSGAQAPAVANGVVVWLEGEQPDAQLDVKTAQGNFTVRLSAIPWGTMVHALDGRAMADRIPPAARLTDSPEEQDYPAATVAKDGTIWLAYTEFKHSPDHDRLRAALREAPADFAAYKTAPGGDQILVKKYSGGAWSAPMAITPRGRRPVPAGDSRGRLGSRVGLLVRKREG